MVLVWNLLNCLLASPCQHCLFCDYASFIDEINAIIAMSPLYLLNIFIWYFLQYSSIYIGHIYQCYIILYAFFLSSFMIISIVLSSSHVPLQIFQCYELYDPSMGRSGGDDSAKILFEQDNTVQHIHRHTSNCRPAQTTLYCFHSMISFISSSICILPYILISILYILNLKILN